MAKHDDSRLKCSFCGKTQDQVKKLIAGPEVYICDECVELCNEILDEEFFENKEKEGKLNDLMPIESFDHPICVRSYLRYFKYNKDIDFARFWDKDYNFKELNNIQIPLFLRWGNVHDLVLQNLSNLIEILKSKIQNEKLDIGYIDGADHGYTGKEETLAKEIISFIG